MIDDDFSKSPQTINELKAFKSDNSKDWKPRDMLVAMLRDIDSGKETMKQAVILYLDGNDNVSYYSANNTTSDVLAMCDVLKHMILTKGRT